MNTLALTRREVEAIQNYVWMHVRATNGTGYKVWEKMWLFLTTEEIQPSLLDIAQRISVE